jgi:hypothetical protein
MYAAVHVFICDNMALSGDEIILNRKHTTRLNVAAELTKAFDHYKDGALVLQRNIEDMKAGPLSLGDAQRKLFEIFYRQLLPTRMLIPVTDSYLSKEDRTDWGLINAITLHGSKNLSGRSPGSTENVRCSPAASGSISTHHQYKEGRTCRHILPSLYEAASCKKSPAIPRTS